MSDDTDDFSSIFDVLAQDMDARERTKVIDEALGYLAGLKAMAYGMYSLCPAETTPELWALYRHVCELDAWLSRRQAEIPRPPAISPAADDASPEVSMEHTAVIH
jgi:hypothetical protein